MKYWHCNELNETKEIKCVISTLAKVQQNTKTMHIYILVHMFLTSIFIDVNVESKVQRKNKSSI